jgi:hypothetical protein
LGAPAGWRPGEGSGRVGLAPGRPGRLVHGPGRLWPWPRRPGLWGEAEGSGRSAASAGVPSRRRRDPHEGVRDLSRTPRSLHVSRPPGECGRPLPRYRWQRSTAPAPGGARSSFGQIYGPKDERALRPVSIHARNPALRAPTITEGRRSSRAPPPPPDRVRPSSGIPDQGRTRPEACARPRAELMASCPVLRKTSRSSPEPHTSRAIRGGHSRPGPPRIARDQTSDGRKRREARAPDRAEPR